MKTFAIDEKPIDIEELAKMKCLNNESSHCSTKSKCSSKSNCCNKTTCAQDKDKKVHIIRDTNEWYNPKTMDDLFDLLTQYKAIDTYRLVGGKKLRKNLIKWSYPKKFFLLIRRLSKNIRKLKRRLLLKDDFNQIKFKKFTLSFYFYLGNTGAGVFKNDGPFTVFIDFKNIPDLFMVKKTTVDLTIGSGITLTKLIEILNSYSSSAGFEYLQVVSFHLTKIAVSFFLNRKNYFCQ